MKSPVAIRPRYFWITIIFLSVIIAIFATIFSLEHGIYEVFPFLYFLPIILFVNFYPKRGVVFSLVISTIFLLLVYVFTNFDPAIIAVSTAWFVIFVTIGFITSSFAEGFQAEEKKYREIFENSQTGIFTFALASRRIQEMNGKCARMLGYDQHDLINKDLSHILLDPAERDSFVSQDPEEFRRRRYRAPPSHKGGSGTPVPCFCIPFPGQQGNLLCYRYHRT